jgi:dTDP-glucose 4,6-dehydratase
MKKFLITGGCGFIGTNFILETCKRYPDAVIWNIDKMSYASKPVLIPASFQGIYRHIQIDLAVKNTELSDIVVKHKPDYIVHFAAESHVDNSIANPNIFIESNVLGVMCLLEAIREASFMPWDYIFLHVSTDEVYGALGPTDPAFTESHPYLPNSPYSASKAASDHLVRAYYKTYGVKAIITHCSNNYGPFQHTEKLIPKVITNALNRKPIPVYGEGKQIRDWIHVSDHVDAIHYILQKGVVGEVYNIGGENEMANIHIIQLICQYLQMHHATGSAYGELITFVPDRLGHDFRYAINNAKINRLGWHPQIKFVQGLRDTISHYAKSL